MPEALFPLLDPWDLSAGSPTSFLCGQKTGANVFLCLRRVAIPQGATVLEARLEGLVSGDGLWRSWLDDDADPVGGMQAIRQALGACGPASVSWSGNAARWQAILDMYAQRHTWARYLMGQMGEWPGWPFDEMITHCGPREAWPFGWDVWQYDPQWTLSQRFAAEAAFEAPHLWDEWKQGDFSNFGSMYDAMVAAFGPWPQWPGNWSTWQPGDPVTWQLDPPPNPPTQDTPDMKALVQQVVDRPGWQAGNAILLVQSPETGESVTLHVSPGQTPGLRVRWA